MIIAKTPLLFALVFIVAFASGGCKRGPLWPADPVIPRTQSPDAQIDAGPSPEHNSSPIMKPQHAVETTIPLGPDLELNGFLASAEHPQGIVVFVHGSSSSRFSVRNNQVAQFLRSQGFATCSWTF